MIVTSNKSSQQNFAILFIIFREGLYQQLLLIISAYQTGTCSQFFENFREISLTAVMSNRNVVMSHRRQTGSTSVFCDLLQDFLQNLRQRRAGRKSTAARAHRALYHHSVCPITVKSSLLMHCKMTCHLKTRTKIKSFIFCNQKKIHFSCPSLIMFIDIW